MMEVETLLRVEKVGCLRMIDLLLLMLTFSCVMGTLHRYGSDCMIQRIY